MALTDTLDDLISERRIEPQLAMKILANFDRSITEVLADKVKARLTFKVLHSARLRGWVRVG
jgi:transcription initiation factor TFIIA small subunit